MRSRADGDFGTNPMKRQTRKPARIPLLRTRPRAERPRVLIIQRGSMPHELPYTLRRSSRRTIGFQIDGKGLTITAPGWVPLREIESSIVEKHQWIFTKQAEWRAYERARAKAAPRFCDGGHIRYLGRRLTLRTNPYTDRYRRTHFLLAEDELWIAGPGVEDPQWVERKVTDWMKQQARTLVRASHAAVRPPARPRPQQLGAQFGAHALGQLQPGRQDPAQLAADPLPAAHHRLRDRA